MASIPTFRTAFYFAAIAGLAACATGAPEGERDYGDDPPLADIDELFAGSPKNDEVEPLESKADDVTPPARYTDLIDLQSPVKSQGSRGVCSIFSTVALMENLYITEGTLSDPDFSEQYLQWSAKFEVNSFPNTSGSNASSNLQAINRFGIVDEATMPYETTEWSTINDPACTGEDDQPTFCYTNGHPSDEIKAAQKFYLPPGRPLWTGSIKTHMMQTGTAAVVGLTFFYQSWNHRKSELGRNMDSWNKGFVNNPTPKDRELSLEKRAGHSILLVGWDDNLEMPIPDEDGNPQVDANGDIVTEKGCFIFKNSWGTTGFGIDSEWGPGYGCISYQYVNTHGRAVVAGLPEVKVPEVCDDGIDNDKNGAADCEDAACAEVDACEQATTFLYEGEGGLSIPDNDLVGVTSSILVEETGTIASLRLKVDISHTYRGDLRVTLYRGDEAVMVHNRTGASLDDLVIDTEVEAFTGTELAGEYRLVVTDNARIDTGTINSWSLSATIE